MAYLEHTFCSSSFCRSSTRCRLRTESVCIAMRRAPQRCRRKKMGFLLLLGQSHFLNFIFLQLDISQGRPEGWFTAAPARTVTPGTTRHCRQCTSWANMATLLDLVLLLPGNLGRTTAPPNPCSVILSRKKEQFWRNDQPLQWHAYAFFTIELIITFDTKKPAFFFWCCILAPIW